jgi:hypothetical protein
MVTIWLLAVISGMMLEGFRNEKMKNPRLLGVFLCPESRLRFEKQASSGQAGHKFISNFMLKQRTLLAEGLCFRVPGTPTKYVWASRT